MRKEINRDAEIENSCSCTSIRLVVTKALSNRFGDNQGGWQRARRQKYVVSAMANGYDRMEARVVAFLSSS
jgi:hypothetical protein